MESARFTYIWRYTIRPERREAFLAAYRSAGDWARLFSRDPNYLGTDLLRNSSDPNDFLTIDYWTSESARDAFREQYAEEFAALEPAAAHRSRHACVLLPLEALLKALDRG